MAAHRKKGRTMEKESPSIRKVRIDAIGEPTSVRTINLPDRQWGEINRIVRDTGQSRSRIMRAIVEEWLAARRSTLSA